MIAGDAHVPVILSEVSPCETQSKDLTCLIPNSKPISSQISPARVIAFDQRVLLGTPPTL